MSDQAQVLAAPAAPQVATPSAAPTGGGLQVADLRAAVGVLAELVEQIPAPAPAAEELPPAPDPTPDPSPVPTESPQAAPVESRLRSSRLWTTIGGMATLAGGHFAGLPTVTQVCITALVMTYIIARAMRGGR